MSAEKALKWGKGPEGAIASRPPIFRLVSHEGTVFEPIFQHPHFGWMVAGFNNGDIVRKI